MDQKQCRSISLPSEGNYHLRRNVIDEEKKIDVKPKQLNREKEEVELLFSSTTLNFKIDSNTVCKRYYLANQNDAYSKQSIKSEVSQLGEFCKVLSYCSTYTFVTLFLDYAIHEY